MEQFDLYIANPVQRQPVAADLPFDGALLNIRGLLRLGLPISDAKAVLQVVRTCGANAYLVPIAYRHPAISIQNARAVALRQHAQIIEAGKRLADLDDGSDDLLWWTFCADDIAAIEDDLTPGRICISVDKLNGRIRTKEEFEQWLQLCAT